MKRLFWSAFLALGLATAAGARESIDAEALAGYEPVESFTAFRGVHSWSPIDEDTLIVWATAFQPYLIELKFPSHDLRFARAIGVTQFGSRVHARHDSVQVRGFRYPIGAIYKLSKEEARALLRS